jgi:hypothetical protein
MRFTPSIFGKLLEPIKRRQFDTLVERHAGDAYVKSFPSWNDDERHLLALLVAQGGRVTSAEFQLTISNPLYKELFI